MIERCPSDRNQVPSLACSPEVGKDARPWILAATTLGSSIAFVNATVVGVALPVIQTDLDASVGEAQWIINAYTLMLAALILASGSAADIFGRRRVFVLGLAMFGLASVWCGLAPDSGQLIAARVVQGLGAALLLPTSLAILIAAYPEEQRGRAIGTWSALTSVAMAIGPFVGGWFVDTISWRLVFFMLVPFVVVNIALALWQMPETRDQERHGGVDWPGAFLATAGLGLLTYGLIASVELGWNSAPVSTTVLGGTLLLLLFVWQEKRATNPMMPLSLFASRPFSGVNLLTLFLYFSIYALFFFLPFNLIQIQGYSATIAGATFMPFTLILAALSRWSGSLRDRYGARKPLILGPLVAAVGFALFALPGTNVSYWTTFFPAIVILGFGMALTVAPLTTTVMTAVPERQAGTASGINNAASRIAGLLAVAILGVVMVFVYGSVLDRQLAEAGVAPEVRQVLIDQRENLAGTQIPPEIDAEQAEILRAAIASSFIAGFRVIMLVSAALALLGAAAAFATIPPREEAAEAA